MLDVFKGLTGRRRYPQKAQPVGILPAPPPTAGNTTIAATTSATGGGGGGSAAERPQQRPPSSARRGGRGLGQGTTARAWALRAAAPPHLRHLSRAKSSSPRGWAAATAAAATGSQGLQQRRPESPVARSGTGDAATSSLLERPELSPVEVER